MNHFNSLYYSFTGFKTNLYRHLLFTTWLHDNILTVQH
jgi:hypothetical protein